MAGKFEVYQDRMGKFRFQLKAANGQVVARSEAYVSKAAARKGCESLQKAADGAAVDDRSQRVSRSRRRAAGSPDHGGAVPAPRPKPADTRSVSRRFRAAGTIDAAPDLSRQVDEILAGDAGRPV